MLKKLNDELLKKIAEGTKLIEMSEEDPDFERFCSELSYFNERIMNAFNANPEKYCEIINPTSEIGFEIQKFWDDVNSQRDSTEITADWLIGQIESILGFKI